jgi:hypothetical protein
MADHEVMESIKRALAECGGRRRKLESIYSSYREQALRDVREVKTERARYFAAKNLAMWERRIHLLGLLPS